MCSRKLASKYKPYLFIAGLAESALLASLFNYHGNSYTSFGLVKFVTLYDVFVVTVL